MRARGGSPLHTTGDTASFNQRVPLINLKMGSDFDPYGQPLSPTSGIISSGQTNLAELKSPVSQDHILKQAKGIPKLTGLSSYEYTLDQG